MNRLLVGLVGVVVLVGLVFVLNKTSTDTEVVTEVVTEEIPLKLDTPEDLEESAQVLEDGIAGVEEEEASIDAELDELENLSF
ncbi:MAG: hypothetical protein K9M10_03270 [Candidatus Pacebacteria bacterium]|nr:hypothetical protein [Candidatus Paceibacterota bacterium]MCF7857475.1 hypothetical protein [Candidatus Paceibacterota bacterium]